MFFIRIIQLFVISVFLYMFFHWAPVVDGWLFPVVSQFEVKIEETERSNKTRIFISFNKPRDCSFRRLEWYLGDPGKSNISLSAVYDFQPPIIRGGTYYEGWGPIDIFISKDLFIWNTYAVVVHDCYNNFLWETRTIAYNGKKHFLIP